MKAMLRTGHVNEMWEPAPAAITDPRTVLNETQRDALLSAFVKWAGEMV
jgi:hypothetical protein